MKIDDIIKDLEKIKKEIGNLEVCDWTDKPLTQVKEIFTVDTRKDGTKFLAVS
nr:MAG TPA: hypothetical protein [Caudoviricetes sp.]